MDWVIIGALLTIFSMAIIVFCICPRMEQHRAEVLLKRSAVAWALIALALGAIKAV